MTAPTDPQRPFERDAFFDDPGIVGARWWNRAYDAEIAATRRQALKAVGCFLAAGAGVMALGVGGVVVAVVNAPVPKLRKAVDVQRTLGWSAGAFDLLLPDRGLDPIPPGTLERLATSIRPRRYAPFYVGTQLEAPFATPKTKISGSYVVKDLRTELRSGRTGAHEADLRAGAHLAEVFAGKALQCLVVIDAPGNRSVAFAAGACTTFEPVLILDNWPHPAGIVPAHRTLGALAAFEPELSAGAAHRPAAPPPLFVLESERIQPLYDPVQSFDNRYFATLPPAKVMRDWGFTRALLIVTGEGWLPESPDVGVTFAEYAAAGMATRVIGLDHFGWDGKYAKGRASFFHHHPWAPVPAGNWRDPGLPDKYRTWQPGRNPSPISAKARPKGFGEVLVDVNEDGKIVGIDVYGGTRDRASGGWGG